MPTSKDKILSRARAKDWQAWQPSDLTLHQVRQKFGATISDEELLLRIYAGPDAVDALMAAGAPKPQLDGKQSLLHLIEQLSKKKDCNHIYISRDGVSLTLGKSATLHKPGVTKSFRRSRRVPTPPLLCHLCG